MSDAIVLTEKWLVLGRNVHAATWLQVWSDLGRAPRTIDAYGRGLSEYLLVCEREGVDPVAATRASVAVFVRDLTSRPPHRGANVVSIDSGTGLSNATIQQRLVPVRLFYDFLMEEGLRESNPVGRGRYTPGRRVAGGGRRGLLPRLTKLPWIPSEQEWLRLLETARSEPPRNRLMLALAYDAALLGFCDPPQRLTGRHSARASGGAQDWAEWVERWHGTSTLTPRARRNVRTTLLKAGRWLEAEHQEATDPAAWTRQTCAAWVAAVDRMNVGDYLQRTAALKDRAGKPLEAGTKAAHIAAVRTFFRDLQEWELVPRRFDPQRALGTPRSIAALLGPDPRVIADEIWAKLMWAGLNLTQDDLPSSQAGSFYPLELVRAVTLAWLFSGQRSDEIARLRTGCIRWQHDDDGAIAGNSDQVLARDAVCLLDVPAHKTGTAFTKPVDPVLGQALDIWQALRPAQPKFTDRRTGEQVDLLFAYRARRVSTSYVNNTVIPLLCRKAGVPAADVRGNITSHRARSTIASQLYNAKEPMTLFELQAWLGHRSAQSTQFYAKVSPVTLTRAYDDAGYFSRNVRTIEVLVDRDAVASGAAAAGEPWQYYDLGHGFCNYTFFEQCQHRMACAKCDFYTPKSSSKGQLLEAKDNLQRMLASIPLTDDEQAAVDDGQAALDQLLERLADVPTPAGPTPREIGVPATATLLPVVT